MSGDWIKMRGNLWDDPRVAGIADATNSSEAAVIGGLYWLWATADQHTEDGLLPGLSVRAIDRKVGIKGFGAALESVGWLKQTDTGVQIPRFEEHNGKSAKTRAQNAKRVANFRGNCNATDNGDVTLPPLHETTETDDLLDSCNADSVTGALARDRDRSKPPKSPPLSKVTRVTGIAFKTFLDRCSEAGEKPISDYRPVMTYAESVGLQTEMLELCWAEFYRRHSPGGASERKRYSDWRQAFRNCVEGNWYKLWWLNPATERFELTTAGRTAERVAA